MTLKIVKEVRLGDDPWFSLYADDKYLRGSYDLAKIERLYGEYKKDPTIFDEKTSVVMEEIIDSPKK
jgi:hypothetical protein